MLKQYFDARNLLQDIEWDKLKKKETKIETIYEAWIALPEDVKNKIEQDFQQIHSLANLKGIEAIVDEGEYHDEDLREESVLSFV